MPPSALPFHSSMSLVCILPLGQHLEHVGVHDRMARTTVSEYPPKSPAWVGNFDSLAVDVHTVYGTWWIA